MSKKLIIAGAVILLEFVGGNVYAQHESLSFYRLSFGGATGDARADTFADGGSPNRSESDSDFVESPPGADSVALAALARSSAGTGSSESHILASAVIINAVASLIFSADHSISAGHHNQAGANALGDMAHSSTYVDLEVEAGYLTSPGNAIPTADNQLATATTFAYFLLYGNVGRQEGGAHQHIVIGNTDLETIDMGEGNYVIAGRISASDERSMDPNHTVEILAVTNGGYNHAFVGKQQVAMSGTFIPAYILQESYGEAGENLYNPMDPYMVNENDFVGTSSQCWITANDDFNPDPMPEETIGLITVTTSDGMEESILEVHTTDGSNTGGDSNSSGNDSNNDSNGGGQFSGAPRIR